MQFNLVQNKAKMDAQFPILGMQPWNAFWKKWNSAPGSLLS